MKNVFVEQRRLHGVLLFNFSNTLFNQKSTALLDPVADRGDYDKQQQRDIAIYRLLLVQKFSFQSFAILSNHS